MGVYAADKEAETALCASVALEDSLKWNYISMNVFINVYTLREEVQKKFTLNS